MRRLALVLIAALALAACGDDSGGAASTDSGEVPPGVIAEDDSGELGVPAGEIGDTLDDGFFAYTLNGFECGVTLPTDPDAAFERPELSSGAQWCRAELTIENVSDRPIQWISINNDGGSLVDDEGRLYEPDTDVNFYMSEDITFETFNPGLGGDADLWFQVPEIASGSVVSFEYADVDTGEVAVPVAFTL